ncbi:uncharacterized protein CELE_T26C11.9 [Caenorhabditis elegans]|uniref:Secreted protein n=1 Tax=Caenorhabditis elegans TaxID=6239 RepID=C6KRG3_CAEEL|nr:Secreted protein [Caenorhabditis elegans]CCD64531.1 Secreted protein [Caenorhabditis elegans]|eukprot:NP_001256991.1 Uncharacterized protein CELE_T26C11.9 [Caenorhabditis elegans]
MLPLLFGKVSWLAELPARTSTQYGYHQAASVDLQLLFFLSDHTWLYQCHGLCSLGSLGSWKADSLLRGDAESDRIHRRLEECEESTRELTHQ